MTRLRLARALVVAVTLCGLAACGDDAGSAHDDELELLDEVHLVVGTKGGVLKAKGVTLEIPEGALDGDVSISVKASEKAAPAGKEATSKIYEFGPEGTKFRQDVTVHIVSDKPSVGGKDVSVYFTKEDEPEVFEKLASHVEDKTVSAKIRHFSMGFAGFDLEGAEPGLDASMSGDSGAMVEVDASTDMFDAGMDAQVGHDASAQDDGSTGLPDATVSHDASIQLPDAAVELPDATVQLPDAAVPDAAVTCDVDCPYDLCAGSACAVTKVSAADGSARDLAVVNGGLFWASGYTVYSCASGSCLSGGVVAMPVPGGSHSYGAIVGLRVGATDYVFVTDNQYMQGLWRAELDGDPFSSWGSANNNAGPLAAFGDVVVWGDQSGTYKASASSSGTTTVMAVAPARVYSGASGPTRRSVAVDGSYIYSANNTDVFKCPIESTCLSSPATAASTPLPNVVAMTIYADTLYALGGSPFSSTGEEQIWSVPTSGGAPTTLSAQVPGEPTGTQHSYVLLADENALYWNSYNGDIYTCARSNCEAELLVPGAGSPTLAQDTGSLYWVSPADGAIYRMAKP